ncbi:MAG: hypothetical protein M3022_19055 [Actinomycetota bacterium]|nr:hypothetical protein [Actinomycetota bacterium]
MTSSRINQSFVAKLVETVVAEAWKVARQRDAVIWLGCDACQDHYKAGLMPASSLGALIRDQTNGSNPRLPDPTRRILAS